MPLTKEERYRLYEFEIHYINSPDYDTIDFRILFSESNL